MPHSTLIPPVGLPVTLAQIKAHLRLDQEEDDDYVLELASAATDHVETHIRQSLISRTLRQYVDAVASNREVRLECWPVQQIVAVTGYDASGDPVVLHPADYSLAVGNNMASLTIANAYPLHNLAEGIEIDFEAGYGPAGKDIPSNIVRAILTVIAHWYELRGSTEEGLHESLPSGIDKLLAPVRRMQL